MSVMHAPNIITIATERTPRAVRVQAEIRAKMVAIPAAAAEHPKMMTPTSKASSSSSGNGCALVWSVFLGCFMGGEENGRRGQINSERVYIFNYMCAAEIEGGEDAISKLGKGCPI